jgi:hypothetical protein
MSIQKKVKNCGVFKNKKGEQIKLFEEKIVSITFPDDVWSVIKKFMIENLREKFIHIISLTDYHNNFCEYSLDFEKYYLDSNYLTDMTSYFDKAKIKKKLKLTTTIKYIVTRTIHSSKFFNKSNKFLKYKSAVCSSGNFDGAKLSKYGYYAVDYPVGDAYIVTK